MKRILLFGGTGESRGIAGAALNNGFFVTLCVATGYAASLVQPDDRLEISVQRLGEEQMLSLMRKEAFSAVIDATHPYAVEATKNIKAAAKAAGLKYLRLLRQASGIEGCAVVKNAGEAAALLNKSEGNIFIATGIKELSFFTGVQNIFERAYVRVLPTVEALVECKSLGFKASHIIAMQGPFDEELNMALFRRFRIETLVTKDGGAAGGFPEKIAAAKRCGAEVILLERPCEKGLSYEEILKFLTFGAVAKCE